MRIEEPKKTFLTIMHLVQSLWNHLKSFKVKCRKTRISSFKAYGFELVTYTCSSYFLSLTIAKTNGENDCIVLIFECRLYAIF